MSTNEKTLLMDRFPAVYRDRDDLEGYFPSPQSLTPFLRVALRAEQQRDMVRDLLQLLDYDGGTTVLVSDRRLADRLEMDKRDVQRHRDDPEFQALVTVHKGEPRRQGEIPRATTYDLAPLLAAWRRYRSEPTPARGWKGEFAALRKAATRQATAAKDLAA